MLPAEMRAAPEPVKITLNRLSVKKLCIPQEAADLLFPGLPDHEGAHSLMLASLDDEEVHSVTLMVRHSNHRRVFLEKVRILRPSHKSA